MIVAYLADFAFSLRACALASYSLHIAATPHLHHALFVNIDLSHLGLKYLWPKPIQRMHMLGLLPFVKEFWIHDRVHSRVHPKLFKHYTLHQFSMLTNVQELGIDYLDIPSFVPRIQKYFGHFLPTVHSLSLTMPKGSHRQIIYFIGLFQHLEDLCVHYNTFNSQSKLADDLTLIPPFSPPL